VRAGGWAETVLGVVALAAPGPWCAALVAASYLAFAAFVVRARGQGRALSSCGCFGRLDTPPTRLHVAVTLGAAAVAVAVAATADGTVLGTIADQPLAGLPFLLFVVTATYLTFLALTALPRVLSFGAAAR
ncbi:MAG: MauE/DoxX family redox-associated membrane protein, partial [Acidimicrobiia bacterium]